MSLDELLKARREEILRIAAKHGARNVRIFGSIARGETDEKSDVDVLVDMAPGRSLLDHAALRSCFKTRVTVSFLVRPVAGRSR